MRLLSILLGAIACGNAIEGFAVTARQLPHVDERPVPASKKLPVSKTRIFLAMYYHVMIDWSAEPEIENIDEHDNNGTEIENIDEHDNNGTEIKNIDEHNNNGTEIENIDEHGTNGTLREGEGCPEFSDLPIADVRSKKFYGVRYYIERGSPIPSLACNGFGFDIEDRHRATSSPGHGIPMGSFFVHYGCKLYVFEDYEYKGKFKTFVGPLSFFEGTDMFHNCHYDDNILFPCAFSYMVECRMHMPDCVPSDEWVSVAYMDNSGSSLSTKFTYHYQIGTEWSSEISQGFNIDVSVTSTITAAFFEIFEASSSATFSTGYDWKSTSTEAKSEATSFTIETEIPAGKILKIEQAQGLCGKSTVKTEMFRTTDPKTGLS